VSTSGLLICAALAGCSVLTVFSALLFVGQLLERRSWRKNAERRAPRAVVECRHITRTFRKEPRKETKSAARPESGRAQARPAVVVKPLSVNVVFEREEWTSPKPVTVLRPKAAWN